MENTFSNIPIFYFVMAVLLLISLSAFFSATETAIMSINRYRLKHQAKTNAKAKFVSHIIAKPEKILSVILICNTFVNILASAIATLIGARIFGDVGILFATIILTIVLLLFGEITPKILGALNPQPVAFFAVLPLKLLLWLMNPIVVITNMLSSALLKIIGVKKSKVKHDALTLDELSIVLSEASHAISPKHKEMLSSVLNLEKMTVNDIMIPRLDVIGIDLNDSKEEIINTIRMTQHTLMPVYYGDLNKITGILHMRDVGKLALADGFNVSIINKHLKPPYFIPEGTPLYKQLMNFQHNKLRIALVVDEYGDVQGIITLEDLLGEIVGGFTTDIADINPEIIPQKDGSTLVDATINLRNLNRILNYQLPTEGAKTLSGLIIDYLEFIPEPKTCVSINNYMMEVIEVQGNMIKTVKFYKSHLKK